ncbi:tomoregulin-2 isoform X4 [Panthera tigris]|uniref:tomoregulin-2 isoform X5 n=1 Tax=Panthera leo TaxID=9689 RepID=UPI001C69B8B1|nr:tomoregulin-2 isoform X5 [Panthera leo]XP_042850886.1 tomoregulin-2 isoform X4 [Panthera tigris]
MVLWESPRQCSSWTLCEGFCWLLLLPVMLLIVARPVKLAAFPTSLSDCQTPTGWNCSGYDDRENDLFLCDTNTCKFDGECLRIGDTVTCVCQFKCNSDYVPVCGSNGESYQNECYLRQAACKQQSEILVVSEGSCATDAGSGSGDGVHEGSGETSQKETSTCDICQFGAECDEDAEDVWCVCNIDCSQTNFNPLCASDGKSYDNACQIKEASCQKQEKIEVMSLGRCQDNTTTTTKSEDGHYARTDYADLTGTGLTEESEGPSKDKEYGGKEERLVEREHLDTTSESDTVLHLNLPFYLKPVISIPGKSGINMGRT